jgi:hypothetical protein
VAATAQFCNEDVCTEYKSRIGSVVNGRPSGVAKYPVSITAIRQVNFASRCLALYELSQLVSCMSRSISLGGSYSNLKTKNCAFCYLKLLVIQWVSGALSLAVKQPGREAGHSLPSSAEVKGASKSFRTDSITKLTLAFGITR